MNEIEELKETLASGETSIGMVSYALGWSQQKVYGIVKANPKIFSCIGIVGAMRTWCIALAGDRPIHMILSSDR